jgi:hypothetical protein
MRDNKQTTRMKQKYNLFNVVCFLFHFQVQLGKQACLGGGQGTLGGEDGCASSSVSKFCSFNPQTMLSKKTPKLSAHDVAQDFSPSQFEHKEGTLVP